MARGLQGVMLRSFGARDHTATVIETISIAPHFVRVRMVSPTLFQDAEAEPAAWLRFWFPDPNGSNTEFQRAYTISEADPAAGRFAVDVVLHDPAGPASSWARTVKPGATIAVMSLMGSSRFDVPEEQPAGYLLIGDSASIPGMNGIIETVPNDVPIEMYLEQHDDNDTLIPLAKHPRLRVRWVMRRDEKSLAEAIENRDWSDWYAWATPEAAALKCVRVRLRDEFGFPKSEIHAQAYWNAGRAMGTHRATEPAATEPEVGAAPQPESAVPAPARGSWRAQAASRLLAPLKLPLVLSGVLAALVTLAQLAPFVLLVELSRLLVSGAGAHRLFTVGFAAVGCWGPGLAGSRPHAVAARDRCPLRQGVALAAAEQAVPVAAGLVHQPRVRIDQKIGHRRHAGVALLGHPCRSGRGRRGCRPGGGAGLSVRRGLASGAGLVRAGSGLPDHHVIAHDPIRAPHCSSAAVGREDERRSG